MGINSTEAAPAGHSQQDARRRSGDPLTESRSPEASSGQRLVPGYQIDLKEDDRVEGRVVFPPFYMGNGDESHELRSVHGGAIALLFDELLGWISLRGGRVRSRTAYLHVNFRAMARVDVELTFSGRTDRVEGRKQFLVGQLKDGDTVLADVESLFVTPREWSVGTGDPSDAGSQPA